MKFILFPSILFIASVSLFFFCAEENPKDFFTATESSSNELIIEEDNVIQLFLGDSLDWEMTCDSSTPKRVSEWKDELGASVVFNGGFFDAEFSPLGKGVYIDEDDKVSFDSQSDYPATIGVLPSGEWYFDRGEGNTRIYSSATSSFPVLIENNEVMFSKETEKYARRTIIAENEKGWWAVFITNYPSLFQSAHLLQEKGFINAINLDGGPSTGLSSDGLSISSAKVVCVFWRE